MSSSWFLGRKIIHVGFTFENVSIGFEDGSGVTIYNPCPIADGFRPDRYIGAKVTTEYWSPAEFHLDLDNGNKISVDLRGEAWVGPEAMVFTYENNGMMVVTEPPEDTETFREENDK